MGDTNSGLKAYPALEINPSPYLLLFSGWLLAIFCLVYCTIRGLKSNGTETYAKPTSMENRQFWL